jgi:predicted GH43/DUF377 family glycosyl hydrolase
MPAPLSLTARLVAVLLLLAGAVPASAQEAPLPPGSSSPEADWMLGPFHRPDGINPLFTPDSTSTFDGPLRERPVRWESMATFNPAAAVRGDSVYVLYRAEDRTGRMEIGGHTSRLGLAASADGLHFTRRPHPVFYPQNDDQQRHEWPGGVEDPRLVETEDGTFVLTYTQWDRDVPQLAVATSENLVDWTKHGPLFPELDRETKSGAIVSRVVGNRLVPTRINGRYWMYWGVPTIYAATSENLIDWTPLRDSTGALQPILSPRDGHFDAWLVEAGPPAVLTADGIVALYNAGNSRARGDASLPDSTYSGGQALFSAEDPTRLLDRADEPFITPEHDYERTGQYERGTTFLEGLVPFRDRWFLYYGAADSRVGVAVSPPGSGP